MMAIHIGVVTLFLCMQYTTFAGAPNMPSVPSTPGGFDFASLLADAGSAGLLKPIGAFLQDILKLFSGEGSSGGMPGLKRGGGKDGENGGNEQCDCSGGGGGSGQMKALCGGYQDYFICTMQCFNDTFQMNMSSMSDVCDRNVTCPEDTWHFVQYKYVIKCMKCIVETCQAAVPNSVCDGSCDGTLADSDSDNGSDEYEECDDFEDCDDCDDCSCEDSEESNNSESSDGDSSDDSSEVTSTEASNDECSGEYSIEETSIEETSVEETSSEVSSDESSSNDTSEDSSSGNPNDEDCSGDDSEADSSGDDGEADSSGDDGEADSCEYFCDDGNGGNSSATDDSSYTSILDVNDDATTNNDDAINSTPPPLPSQHTYSPGKEPYNANLDYASFDSEFINDQTADKFPSSGNDGQNNQHGSFGSWKFEDFDFPPPPPGSNSQPARGPTESVPQNNQHGSIGSWKLEDFDFPPSPPGSNSQPSRGPTESVPQNNQQGSFGSWKFEDFEFPPPPPGSNSQPARGPNQSANTPLNTSPLNTGNIAPPSNSPQFPSYNGAPNPGQQNNFNSQPNYFRINRNYGGRSSSPLPSNTQTGRRIPWRNPPPGSATNTNSGGSTGSSSSNFGSWRVLSGERNEQVPSIEGNGNSNWNNYPGMENNGATGSRSLLNSGYPFFPGSGSFTQGSGRSFGGLTMQQDGLPNTQSSGGSGAPFVRFSRQQSGPFNTPWSEEQFPASGVQQRVVNSRMRGQEQMNAAPPFVRL